MKKNIFIKEKNYQQLRKSLKKKLEQHPHRDKLGDSNQSSYGLFVKDIQNNVKSLLKESPYKNNWEFKVMKDPEKEITAYKLWVILYQTEKYPEKRKAMSKVAIELLMLYAHDEIREEWLEEETAEKKKLESKHSPSDIPQFSYVENLSLTELQYTLKNARDEIKILETFLNNWSSLKEYLQQAVELGCRVKILLCDPQSPPIILRSERITTITEFPKQSIERKKAEIQSWKNAHLVEINMHPHVPGFNLFAIDDVYFIGLFWFHHEAMQGPFMKVFDNRRFKITVNKHFKGLWDEANSYKGSLGIKSIDKFPSELEPFVGTWQLYCNKGEKGTEGHKSRPMEHGRIVENLVKLEKNGATLKVSFFSNYNGEFSGIANICPLNTSYLEVRITTKSPPNALCFLLHIGNGLTNHLIGLYNYMYHQQPTILGTGLAAMVKIDDKIKRDLKYEDWKPRDVETIKDEDIKKIIRYLTFSTGSRVEAIQDFDHLKQLDNFNQPFLFSGVYKIFAYKGSSNNTYITESLLKIDEYRRVFHKRSGEEQLGTFVDSEGRAELSNKDCLIISLKNKESGRLGYFIINVSDRVPRKKEYYVGVFGGAALSNDRNAIGSRVILTYLGNDMSIYSSTEIKRYSILAPEIEEIPNEIRINLTGRVNNFIGFFHNTGIRSPKKLKNEASETVDMKNVFFDSACQRALSNDVNQIWNAAKMFERAVLHGFQPINAFEEKLNEYEDEGLIGSKMKDGILNNEVFLKLMNSF